MDPAQAPGLGEPATEGKLHYVCYDAKEFDKLNIEGATAMFNGAIVISHGFTEFATKYSEMIWYFMLAGYSVCFLEHRGHGRSVRDIDNPSLVWIDDWHRYVADLNKFAFDVGREYAGGRPLFLYSHSMGGGIGAALLETYPDTFDRAVLSSPMIAPQTGMPNWIAYLLSSLMCVCGLGKHIVFGQSEFTPELDMSDHQGACEARVRWYQQQRIDDVQIRRMRRPSNGCGSHSSCHTRCRSRGHARISTPHCSCSKRSGTNGCSMRRRTVSSTGYSTPGGTQNSCASPARCTKSSACRTKSLGLILSGFSRSMRMRTS